MLEAIHHFSLPLIFSSTFVLTHWFLHFKCMFPDPVLAVRKICSGIKRSTAELVQQSEEKKNPNNTQTVYLLHTWDQNTHWDHSCQAIKGLNIERKHLRCWMRVKERTTPQRNILSRVKYSKWCAITYIQLKPKQMYLGKIYYGISFYLFIRNYIDYSTFKGLDFTCY